MGLYVGGHYLILYEFHRENCAVSEVVEEVSSPMMDALRMCVGYNCGSVTDCLPMPTRCVQRAVTPTAPKYAWFVFVAHRRCVSLLFCGLSLRCVSDV